MFQMVHLYPSRGPGPLGESGGRDADVEPPGILPQVQRVRGGHLQQLQEGVPGIRILKGGVKMGIPTSLRSRGVPLHMRDANQRSHLPHDRYTNSQSKRFHDITCMCIVYEQAN